MAARVLAFLIGAMWLGASNAGPVGNSQPVATGLLVLADSTEPGIPLVVKGRVRNRRGQPVVGAEILVFHTDQRGWYTRERVMDERKARLKGRVRTGPGGVYEIRTIRPGPYPAGEDTPENRRIPEHIHYEVTAEGYRLRRFQFVFQDDPRMTPYWHDWARRDRNPVGRIERVKGGTQICLCDITLETES